ncbi:hypothetical protein KCU78_g12107, partial [Aureobasidium melanogenum]
MAPLDSSSNQSRGPNHTNNDDPVRSWQLRWSVLLSASSRLAIGDVLQPDSHLLQFVNNIDGSPTEEMAEKALEDIQSLWPSTAKDLTPTMLLQIHHCLRASKIAIRYSHLRLFLVRCASSIEEAQQPLDDPKAKEIALDTEKFVSKALELK